MLKRLIDYLFPSLQQDFYIPATRRHLAGKQLGPDRIIETSLYDPKDDAWYVQSFEKFRGDDGYTSREIAAWTYLPIRRLTRVSEEKTN